MITRDKPDRALPTCRRAQSGFGPVRLYWFWTGNLWYLWYGLWWSGALDFERMPGSYEAADFKFVWRFGVMNQDSYSILL